MTAIICKRALIALCLACAPHLAPADSQAAFDDLWREASSQSADAEAQAYLQGLQPHALWRDGGALRAITPPHDKALLECVTAVFPTPSPVRMVFRIGKSGDVTEARSDQPGYVSDCMTSKIVALRIPVPPKDGFLLCQRFERDGDRTTVTPCGPVGWHEQCEQQGTSKRCRNEFK